MTKARQALDRFVEQWIASLLAGDAEAAARLRAEGYSLRLPNGSSLSATDELRLFGGERPARLEVKVDQAELSPDGDRATVALELDGGFDTAEGASELPYRCTLQLARPAGEWKALAAAIERTGPPWQEEYEETLRPLIRRLLPRRLGRLLGRVRRMAGAGTYQASAYIPYRPGESFLLPPVAAPREGALPIPPRHLWLGYNYPAHGKAHVATMLRAVERSGLVLAAGDRILDLGCGAGRMIRHLEHLAEDCEIWGADISAEHIFWCKQHLSPPFNFATTTKVPSLPFEDRSFALIYCGSLFTHIDDMADAWLLELHRILAPGGRLYVTIHDENTMKLFDQPSYAWSQIVRTIKAQPLFAQAQGGFGMLALGRDNLSQVFYQRSFFRAMTDRMFDTLETIEEGYFYQTAIVLRRRTDRATGASG